MLKNWIGKNTVYFFTVALSYLSWVTEYSLVPEGNTDLPPVSRIYLQDIMETVQKENFTDGTLLSDLWNKRTLTFDSFKIMSLCMKVSFVFFFRFEMY